MRSHDKVQKFIDKATRASKAGDKQASTKFIRLAIDAIPTQVKKPAQEEFERFAAAEFNRERMEWVRTA